MKKMKKMKKKYLFILLILCLISTLTVWYLYRETPVAQEAQRAHAAGVVDVDLTALSSIMVSAELSRMMMNPENYMGKVIKASGTYSPYYHQAGDKLYHYLIIADAGGCCEQVLEFILSGKRAYPEVQATIELTGVFARYKERFTRYYLAVDNVSILK